jgi:nucleoside-diphosphate-sugar epimerase
MKIVVTGAAGFIGSHTAERFASLGHEVIGIDAFTDYYSLAWKESNAADVTSQGVKLVRLDLAVDELTAVLANTDFIFHLAGQPGISATTSLETYIRNNIVTTNRLLEASRQLPALKCFVNISTSSVYGAHATDSEEIPPKPTSYYGVTKLAAEQLALAYQREQGFPACSLRIFSVYGPRERPEKLYPKLIRSILTGEPFPLHEGSEQHSRSYTFVSDIIDGFTAVLRQPEKAIGEIFNIGSDIEMTTGEGIRIIEEIMGQKAIMKKMPKRPGDQLRTCANIEKAGRLLGYEPRTRLEDGLRAEVEWYEEKIFGKGIH